MKSAISSGAELARFKLGKKLAGIRGGVTMSTGAEVLKRYAEVGIPIHHYDLTAKASNETGWPETAARGVPLDELLSLIGKRNFGALTGVKTSGGILVDVDFDSDKPEVNRAGSAFLLDLLPTATFGRKSKPVSHAMYFLDQPIVSDKLDGVIELRGTKKDGTLGLQTMVAPSVHTGTGDPLEWSDPNFHITSVSAAELESVYRLTKILMVILEYTEGKHFDHDSRVAAAGHFLRTGLDQKDVVRLLTAVARERGVEDIDDVSRGVTSTAARIKNNEPVSVKPFSEWLGPMEKDATKAIGIGRRKEVVTIRASEIEPRAVRWLWENKLPLGENALMTGREDTGKSTVLLELAAQITRGKLPGAYFGQPREVIIATTEDSWHHTIVPRLMAAGADLERVHQIGVQIESVSVVAFPSG